MIFFNNKFLNLFDYSIVYVPLNPVKVCIKFEFNSNVVCVFIFSNMLSDDNTHREIHGTSNDATCS